jgi:NAD(P)-dependent dehydrogenase (short-subunit alcohol dehydrogenase family)
MVFAAVKNDEELNRIRSEIKERDIRLDTGTIRPMIMDVLSPDSINEAVQTVKIATSNGNPLVGVVNNAGLCMISPMELTPEKASRDLFELDFWGYIRVIQAFLPLVKQYQGRFINIGSFGGYANPPMWVTYCAAKAAIEGMTRSWRFELQPFGVGMTSVRPGWTRCVKSSDPRYQPS